MGGDLTWGGEHTTQYTDDALQNCTPETDITLLKEEKNYSHCINYIAEIQYL